jgi:hypothetical protein
MESTLHLAVVGSKFFPLVSGFVTRKVSGSYKDLPDFMHMVSEFCRRDEECMPVLKAAHEWHSSSTEATAQT